MCTGGDTEALQTLCDIGPSGQGKGCQGASTLSAVLASFNIIRVSCRSSGVGGYTGLGSTGHGLPWAFSLQEVQGFQEPRYFIRVSNNYLARAPPISGSPSWSSSSS